MNIFQQLLEVNEQKTKLELKYQDVKREFEESVIKLTETLKQTKEEELRLREQVTETLKSNNETSISLEDKVITRQVKTTLKITEPEKLISSLMYNAEKIGEIGYNVDQLKESFKHETVIVPEYKKELLDIVSKYEDIEGKLLNGAERQETQFIVIKNN